MLEDGLPLAAGRAREEPHPHDDGVAHGKRRLARHDERVPRRISVEVGDDRPHPRRRRGDLERVVNGKGHADSLSQAIDVERQQLVKIKDL